MMWQRWQRIDNIHNFWRFRSVQFGTASAVFMAPITFYGACLAISPAIVSGVPHWFLTFCSIGGMVSAAVGVMSRGVKQNLPPKPGGDDDAGA